MVSPLNFRALFSSSGSVGYLFPISHPVNPASAISLTHCWKVFSAPKSGISSFVQPMGAIPNFTLLLSNILFSSKCFYNSILLFIIVFCNKSFRNFGSFFDVFFVIHRVVFRTELFDGTYAVKSDLVERRCDSGMVYHALFRPQTFVIAAGTDGQVFTVIQMVYEDLLRICFSERFQAGTHLMEVEGIQCHAHVGKSNLFHHIIGSLELVDGAGGNSAELQGYPDVRTHLLSDIAQSCRRFFFDFLNSFVQSYVEGRNGDQHL